MNTLLLPGGVSIDAKQILYLESDSCYTIIYKKTSPQKVIAALSLCHVQHNLDSPEFVRINRKQVLNISFISKFWEDREFLNIKLKNGLLCRTSRRRTLSVLNSIIPQNNEA